MTSLNSLPAISFVETVEDAAAFWQIGILWRVLATGHKTGGKFCAFDEVVADQPGGPVTHAHPQDELFYLLEGSCTFHAGGQSFKAGRGDFIFIPRYTQHAFLADAGARLLNFYLPAGFELLLMGLAGPAERNEPPTSAETKLPPRRLVEKLSRDYGQIPVLGLPFADPPDPAKMTTKPLPGARALPLMINASAAPSYWNSGILWSVLADGHTTGDGFALFEELCSKDSGAPPHAHVFDDEVFYVLEGDVEFLLGGNRQMAGEGSLIFIPRSTVHAFKVRSAAARLLNLYTGPGFERLIEMTGEKTEQRTLPPAGWTPPTVSNSRLKELFVEIGMLQVDVPNPLD